MPCIGLQVLTVRLVGITKGYLCKMWVPRRSELLARIRADGFYRSKRVCLRV